MWRGKLSVFHRNEKHEALFIFVLNIEAVVQACLYGRFNVSHDENRVFRRIFHLDAVTTLIDFPGFVPIGQKQQDE